MTALAKSDAIEVDGEEVAEVVVTDEDEDVVEVNSEEEGAEEEAPHEEVLHKLRPLRIWLSAQIVVVLVLSIE